MLPSQKRLLPYEALSACVQPQEKDDRLTDKPGDSDCSFVQSPVSQGEGARQFQFVELNKTVAGSRVRASCTQEIITSPLFHASFMREMQEQVLNR